MSVDNRRVAARLTPKQRESSPLPTRSTVSGPQLLPRAMKALETLLPASEHLCVRKQQVMQTDQQTEIQLAVLSYFLVTVVNGFFVP
ncbi:MAG: hypothetical protein ABGZ53_27430 [Fuerstiella sp.]|jgi:hypothetical protein